VSTANQSTTCQIIERHDGFMSLNYPRYPIAMAQGDGCRLRDADGRQYLDMFSSFGAALLGHCHGDLVAALQVQAGRLWHAGNLMHAEPQTRAAEAIARTGFNGRSFFCHSGADANEAAFKLARLFGRARPAPDGSARYQIICMDRSFHGRSFGTMAATGTPSVRQGFEPPIEGFVHVPYNDAGAVKEAINPLTVAVIVEPIQGEGGVHVPDDDYLPALRRLCDENDMLLICDEVWTGCGRTGRYFAHQHWSIEPDIMTLAKGVGGGLPVAVMCAKPQLAELYNCATQGGVKHATTLGGNCLGTAVTTAIFEVLARDGLVEQAATLGDHAMQRLRRFAERCDLIKQVRGKGMFIGIELVETSKTSFPDPAAVISRRCLEKGLIINGTQQTILRLAPPLIATRDEIDEGLDMLEGVVEAFGAG
jgi:acetylornithine/N-succinyldiaminopimelate aminotransferase